MALRCLICKNNIFLPGVSGSKPVFYKFDCRWALAIVIGLLFLWFPENSALSAENAAGAPFAPVWDSLAKRLARDGLAGKEVDALMAELGDRPTQDPMGRKMRELYRRQFFPRQAQPKKQQYYKGVVTEANAVLCRDYIREYKTAFTSAQFKYGVPPAIACALLFVETRLGKVLGDIPENAFYTLASMAVSTTPADISSWLAKMPGYGNHLGWIEETMRKRADWAYNETKALVRHMLKDGITPARLPGSIYGAVGLCQFMPSNITPYGADGDGDGKVDLFTPADAIASLANYLHKHGWRSGMSVARQHKLLMTYNHSTVYANTILALARLVENPGGSKPATKSKKAA